MESWLGFPGNIDRIIERDTLPPCTVIESFLSQRRSCTRGKLAARFRGYPFLLGVMDKTLKVVGHESRKEA
jgi:hypothetical protein